MPIRPETPRKRTANSAHGVRRSSRRLRERDEEGPRCTCDGKTLVEKEEHSNIKRTFNTLTITQYY